MSKSLNNAESRYSNIKKLAYALVISERKLRPYFESHLIVVYTNAPLLQVFHKLDQSRRMLWWSIELCGQDVTFVPRSSYLFIVFSWTFKVVSDILFKPVRLAILQFFLFRDPAVSRSTLAASNSAILFSALANFSLRLAISFVIWNFSPSANSKRVACSATSVSWAAKRGSLAAHHSSLASARWSASGDWKLAIKII